MKSSTSPSASGAARRALLRLSALLATAVMGLGSLPALASGPYGRIIVDVAPLEAKGLGGYARVVQGVVEAAAAKSFAGDVLPGRCGLPSLIIEISGVSLSAYAGGGGVRPNSSGPSNDSMSGRLLTEADGRIVAAIPMLSALPATSGGAWYAPDFDRRRLRALAEHFTWWSRRKLGD